MEKTAESPQRQYGHLKALTTSPVGSERPWDMSLAEKEYLTDMYDELVIIATTHSFEIYGFGDGGPHAWWMDDMDQYQNGSLSSTGAIIANDTAMLSLAYVFDDSEDISYFTNIIPRQLENGSLQY